MTAGRFGTRFLETEILMAVLEDDADAARARIRSMLPGERYTFALQLDKLQGIVSEVGFYVPMQELPEED